MKKYSEGTRAVHCMCSTYRDRKLDNSASINIFSPVDFVRSSINSARVSSNLSTSINICQNKYYTIFTQLQVEHYLRWHHVNPIQDYSNYLHIHWPMNEIQLMYASVHMDSATKHTDTNPNQYDSINH